MNQFIKDTILIIGVATTAFLFLFPVSQADEFSDVNYIQIG